MRSDTIIIDNRQNGFTAAVEETKKVAAFNGLDAQKALELQMLTEEMLSLARSVTGEMTASFWIDIEEMNATLHMSTQTVLNKEQRAELIASSTSRRNEATKTFLGALRDWFDEARAAEPQHFTPDRDLLNDLPIDSVVEKEWDGYERSILRKLADEVKISIVKDQVEMTVFKRF